MYTYYTSAASKQRPTLLLLHGCPDVASLWSDLIRSHLQPAGYGVLAPDLVGYGGSSKPSDLERYAQQNVTKDLVDILDHEGIATTVVVGHDFGAFLASKMCSFQPARVSGLITLGTAYVPPSLWPFDFEQVKAIQEKYQGYCSSWYFPLFMSPSGAQLIDDNLENMFTALHGGGSRMKDVLCVEGGIENWLGDPGSASADVLPYAIGPDFRNEWVGRLRRDGWSTPLNWYKALTSNLSLGADKTAVEVGGSSVKAPYLIIAALQDPLSLAAAVQGPIMQGFLPEVDIKEVDAGHWLMLEKPPEVGKFITDWLNEKFKNVST